MSKYDKAKHSKKKRKSPRILSKLFLIIIIIVLGYYFYGYYLSGKNKSIYEQIKVEEETWTEGKTENMKKVEHIKNKNNEVIGWIQIKDTTINYPLLQTKDNEYYLNHNYQKEKSKYGSIFLKAECNLLDNHSNLIIYGHNTNDKQMFYPLLNYMDKNYYENHKIIQITTEQEESNYSIVAVFQSRIFYDDEKNVFKYYHYTDFKDEKQYDEFI